MNENLRKQRLEKAELYFKYGWVKHKWGILPANAYNRHWILEQLFEGVVDSREKLQRVKPRSSISSAIRGLKFHKLIEENENHLSLTDLGQALCELIYKHAPKSTTPTFYMDYDKVGFSVDKETKEISEYDYKIRTK